jgi:hypothetical protein
MDDLKNSIKKFDIPEHYTWIYKDNVDGYIYILCKEKPSNIEKDTFRVKFSKIGVDSRMIKWLSYWRIIGSYNDLLGPLPKKVCGGHIKSLWDPKDIEQKCKDYLSLIDAHKRWIADKHTELDKWLNTKSKTRRNIMWMNFNALMLLSYVFLSDEDTTEIEDVTFIEMSNISMNDKLEKLSLRLIEKFKDYGESNEYNRTLKKINSLKEILEGGEYHDINISFIIQRIYDEIGIYMDVNFYASNYLHELQHFWPK